MQGMTEGKRSEWQRMKCLNSFTNPMGVNLSKLQEIVADRGATCAAACWVTKSQT